MSLQSGQKVLKSSFIVDDFFNFSVGVVNLPTERNEELLAAGSIASPTKKLKSATNNELLAADLSSADVIQF